MAEIDLGVPGLEDYKEIGSGGFASVFAAFEPEANRQVAVKVMAAMGERAQRRFDRERRTMGQTTAHDNIVTLFRSGYTTIGERPHRALPVDPGADRIGRRPHRIGKRRQLGADLDRR